MQDFEKSLGDSTEVAQFDEPKRSLIQHIQHFLHSHPTAVPIIVLLVSVLIFGSIANNFFTPFNMPMIVQQLTIIGILGIAMTLIVLTAGIDRSVAAIMVLSTVVMGGLGVNLGIPPRSSPSPSASSAASSVGRSMAGW